MEHGSHIFNPKIQIQSKKYRKSEEESRLKAHVVPSVGITVFWD